MTNEIVTFGCRLNIFESEVIKNQLKLSNTDNVTVFNSCAVTSEAERQLRQSIRRHRKNHPDKTILVTGCAAQINPEFYANLPEVDGVLGNQEKLNADNYKKITTEKSNILVQDIEKIAETAGHMVASFEGKCRAFLEIQNGCNHRCTFCIIPFGRGNNRSVPVNTIIENCQNVLNSGYNEIVLTGVDITDYGVNLPDKPSLGFLVKEILSKLPELKRLRLSSLDVSEIDDDLLELIKYEPRLLGHFHLSLQSGDNMILKRMKRRHNREQIYEFCNLVRKYRKDVIFGADIIAGFPTETEEMFQNTLDLVNDLNIALLHVFPYSQREGTPAAKIPSNFQIAKNIRKERAKILINAGKKQLDFVMQQAVNKEFSVIVENNEILRTEGFLKVKMSNDLPAGSLCRVKITGVDDGIMLGELLC